MSASNEHIDGSSWTGQHSTNALEGGVTEDYFRGIFEQIKQREMSMAIGKPKKRNEESKRLGQPIEYITAQVS